MFDGVVMRKIFIALLIILFFCGFSNAVENFNFTKKYESRIGNVTFDHGNHAITMKNCSNCHQLLEQYGGKVNKDYGHDVCKECHRSINKDYNYNIHYIFYNFHPVFL